MNGRHYNGWAWLRDAHKAWKRYAGSHDRYRTPLPKVPVLARMPRSLKNVPVVPDYSLGTPENIERFFEEVRERKLKRATPDDSKKG